MYIFLNMAFSVHNYVFRLIIWSWITNGVLFPGKDCFSALSVP